MITYTNETRFEGSQSTLRSIQDEINDAIKNHGAKITIRQLYKDYLGIEVRTHYGLVEINGEYYDPDEWGWDKDGFRQLYRTRIEVIKEEL